MERVLEPEVMDTAEEAAEYDSMDHTEPNAAFLARLVELGARVAEPGEFTRRAFESGRIDLSRAEGVLSLVEARSEAARRSASMNSSCSRAVSSIDFRMTPMNRFKMTHHTTGLTSMTRRSERNSRRKRPTAETIQPGWRTRPRPTREAQRRDRSRYAQE